MDLFEKKEDQLLAKELLKLEKTLLLAAWREVAAEKLFNDLRLTSITAIDEHSLQNRSIFDPAKRLGIRTIAIQHGAISKGNIAYRFVEQDKGFQPWPTISLIRGSFNRGNVKEPLSCRSIGSGGSYENRCHSQIERIEQRQSKDHLCHPAHAAGRQ